MPENFEFVHNFPDAPRTFQVGSHSVTASTISVRRVLNKAKARCLLIVAKELPSAVKLWDRGDYDTQAAGAGFGQAEIEARIDEVFAAA